MKKTNKITTLIALCLCFIMIGAVSPLHAAPNRLVDAPLPADVELSHWSEIREILPLFTPIRVTDAGTGIVYYVSSLSNGNHADVEPLTAHDTALLMMSFNWMETWTSRPVWVTIGNRTFAAAIHSMPHDIQTIADNNMDGHVCLHFFGSTTHASNAPTHLATVMEAHRMFGEIAAAFGMPPTNPPPSDLPLRLLFMPETSDAVPYTPSPREPAFAVPSSHGVHLNGALVSFSGFNIDGYNFFRLRDVAFALNGTRSQFQVAWDAHMSVINLLPGWGYTPIGTEMAQTESGATIAMPSTAPVLVSGMATHLRAYNIGGYTYFRLRDLGAALGFLVDWDDVLQTILIEA